MKAVHFLSNSLSPSSDDFQSDSNILSPIMNILITEHFPNLPVAQGCFVFPHFPGDLRSRMILLQKVLGSPFHGDSIVGRIENLETQPALLDRKVADLAEITGINVTPSTSFARIRIFDISWKIPLIFMGLDDIANAERVDVVLEATGK